MGMGRAAERIEILNAQLPLFRRLGLSRTKTSEFVARSPLRLGRREEAYFAPLILSFTHLSTSLARLSRNTLLAPCSVSNQQS